MSADFAATSAQIVPVLALALIAVLVSVQRLVAKAISKIKKKGSLSTEAPAIVAGVILFLILTWLMFHLIDAESLCLKALRGVPVAKDAAKTISSTLTTTMVWLFVIPILGIVVTWALEGQSSISHILTRKKTHSRQGRKADQTLDSSAGHSS